MGATSADGWEAHVVLNSVHVGLCSQPQPFAEVPNISMCLVVCPCYLSFVGGLGKTEMARLLEDSLRANFENSFMIELPVVDPDPSTQLQNVLTSWGTPASSVNASKQALLGMLLSRFQQGSVLLIIDNVTKGSELDDILPEGWELTEGSCVIITSRSAWLSDNSSSHKVSPVRQCDDTWHVYSTFIQHGGFVWLAPTLLHCNQLELVLAVAATRCALSGGTQRFVSTALSNEPLSWCYVYWLLLLLP